MARVKRAMVRNPTSVERRRSPRTKENDQASSTNMPQSPVVLEDNSISPQVRAFPFLHIISLLTKDIEVDNTSVADKGESSTRPTSTGEDSARNLLAIIAHPKFIAIEESQVLPTVHKSLVDGSFTSCSQDDSDRPIASTKIDLGHFKRYEFDSSFGPLNPTANEENTPVDVLKGKEILVSVENPNEEVVILDTPETLLEKETERSEDTLVENLEVQMELEREERTEDPFVEFPHTDVMWTEEDEPIVTKTTKKRKRLGKVYAKKTNREGSRKSKRTKRVMTEGEPSGTKHSDTNCYVAASLQHEKYVRRKERSEEPAIPPPPRPTSPYNGFSSKAAAKMWPKFQTKIGFPEKGIDEHSMREFHFIRQVVDTQGLSKLCHVYASYNLTLIREFNCEMSVTSASKIQVRGTTVNLAAKRINQFLGLNPPKKTE
ncbi:hypothetical protein L6452_11445 [Arctium lappa]|uniref:Uncharacterized protein n=1 Tax=Arctium lappa TaxID=4217 RepID=A0ACB9DPR4_ARCLA|nr:hypothetical protein L6452_11445 [Arctium lappa]